MVVAKLVGQEAARHDFEAELASIVAGSPPPAEVALTEDAPADAPASQAVRKPAARRAASSSPAEPPTIREMPTGQRPRERLRQSGADVLNESELLAILLRTGMKGENVVAMATRIIAEFGGLAGLSRAGYGELSGQRGLSDAKVCQVLAALELGKRVVTLSPAERPQVSCAQDAASLVAPDLQALDQESLVVLLLNTRNHVLLKRTIYVGTVNSSAVRPAEVLRPAIRENAPSIIVAHNHPSGDPTPSPEDVAVTRDLVAAGKLMDIDVLDHLVIGSGGRFTSLKERGLGFDR